MTRSRNPSTSAHHARAAVGTWSLSRPSSAGAGRAHRRPAHCRPGRSPRDPAPPERAIRPSNRASGNDPARLAHHHRSRQYRDLRPAPPTTSSYPATIWHVGIASDPKHRRQRDPQGRRKTENPIAHRVRPAGSCSEGYRTPAGARYPSRLWPLSGLRVGPESRPSFMRPPPLRRVRDRQSRGQGGSDSL